MLRGAVIFTAFFVLAWVMVFVPIEPPTDPPDAVMCCCETSGGGLCCANVTICGGDYIPGCYCK